MSPYSNYLARDRGIQVIVWEQCGGTSQPNKNRLCIDSLLQVESKLILDYAAKFISVVGYILSQSTITIESGS